MVYGLATARLARVLRIAGRVQMEVMAGDGDG
jgi:hypothetical protein